MATTGSSLGDSWNARMRLIRLRRKKESFRFRDEFRVVPAWLKILCFVLWAIAVAIGAFIMVTAPDARPYDLRDNMAASVVAMAGIITAVSLVISVFFFALGYVNRDARRRGMNSALWTLIVLLFLPTWGIIGFIIYFLLRDPLPYACPRCNSPVGPRFNYCPNCQCNLNPVCPQCKESVAETDKYCPYCANELLAKAADRTNTSSAPSPEGSSFS
jgi:hypothetical protein